MFKNLAKLVAAILLVEAIVLMTYSLFLGYQTREYRKSDMFARQHILQLYGNNVLCTGVEVVSSSGKVYTLTAAHCKSMIIDNGVNYQEEDKGRGRVNVIKIDEELDLLLLKGVSHTGFRLGDSMNAFVSVHTMTHGLGMPAYRTNGELLAEDALLPTLSGLGTANRLLTTAEVLPGSSGGPVLNAGNELLGIVHVRRRDYGGFSYAVSLTDIKKFMEGF